MPDNWDFSSKPERENTLSQIPFITYGLAGICILITIANQATKGQTPDGSFFYQLGNFGFQTSDSIWEGKYYALFTSFFLHGDFMHLLFNMVWLTRLGRVMELTMNPLTYLLFMVGATLVGSCAELAVSGQTGIGASGAVYAMFGLLWAGRGYKTEWRNIATRENLNIFLIWGVLCIVLTWAKLMSIANAAHFGGFLFGLCIGWLFYSPRRQPLWAIPLSLLAVLCVLSLTWLPWSRTWTFWKGVTEFKKEHYPQAAQWFHRSLALGGDQKASWHNIIGAWHNLAIYEREQRHPEALKRALDEEAAAIQEAGPLAETSPAEKSNPPPSKHRDESGDK